MFFAGITAEVAGWELRWRGGSFPEQGSGGSGCSADEALEVTRPLGLNQVVKQAPPRLRVRWAALLHDVGKAATVTVDAKSQKLQFRKHESVGGTMVDSILASYGYHEQFRREVATLVLRSGRIRSVENFHDQGARRLLSVSGPLFIDLLDLYKADCTSMSPRRQQEHQDRAHQLVSLVKGVLTRDIMRIKRPPLNGNEVMALTGLTAGIALGRLMRGLREDYLSRGPYTYDEAVQVALRLHKEYLKVPECKSTRKLSKLSFLKKVLCDEDEEGLVFRIMLDQGAGQSERSPWRDIVVQRNTSLFDFAAAVVHAFDFDFDDRFSFFRRSRVGSSCPGAEAACRSAPTPSPQLPPCHVHATYRRRARVLQPRHISIVLTITD